MKQYVRTILDYPIKGIKFRDITPLLQSRELFSKVIQDMSKPWENAEVDVIVGIESRGFIFAGAMAHCLGAAFVPLRKPNKLPYDTYSVEYDLEYGQTEMHIHRDALDDATNILIVDDLLATGGTALAAIELIQRFEAKNILGAGFVINLPELGGFKKLQAKRLPVDYLMKF